MRLVLTYQQHRCWLHGSAYLLLLVSFILLLLPAFGSVMSLPLFEISSPAGVVYVGTRGLCARVRTQASLACVSRGFSTYYGKMPEIATNVSRMMMRSSNGPLIASVLLLMGMGFIMALLACLFRLERAAFRVFSPPWRELTTTGPNVLLCGSACWTMLVALADQAHLWWVGKQLRDGLSHSLPRAVVSAAKGSTMMVVACLLLALATLLTALILLCWDSTAENRDFERFLDAKHVSPGHSYDDAIEEYREMAAHSEHPPHRVSTQRHGSEHDEPVAQDGGELPVYVDAEGHKHKQMIAVDISMSPTRDETMPTPKELRPEDHPAALPVWAEGGHRQARNDDIVETLRNGHVLKNSTESKDSTGSSAPVSSSKHGARQSSSSGASTAGSTTDDGAASVGLQSILNEHDPPAKKHDLPMDQAIDQYRFIVAHGCDPPLVAHEDRGGVNHDEDDNTDTDGRERWERSVDAHNHTQKPMIAPDICPSPSLDSGMPSPKHLRPEDHPATSPVWKRRDFRRPKGAATRGYDRPRSTEYATQAATQSSPS